MPIPHVVTPLGAANGDGSGCPMSGGGHLAHTDRLNSQIASWHVRTVQQIDDRACFNLPLPPGWTQMGLTKAISAAVHENVNFSMNLF